MDNLQIIALNELLKRTELLLTQLEEIRRRLDKIEEQINFSAVFSRRQTGSG